MKSENITGKDGIIPVFPIDGDMLHPSDGNMQNGALVVTASVNAPPGSEITINGTPATLQHGLFTAPLMLNAYRNTVEIKDAKSGASTTIAVYRLLSFEGKYRLSIDDNIRFLQDIAANAQEYRSIFDNPYLKHLKDLNTRYGTKVHLNLFYQTDGFDISQFPEKFKSEWEQQSHWLRLSFHALQEFPDRPYQHASFEEVSRDCAKVLAEIKRFSGEKLLGPVTTVHWGEVTREGSRALRQAGYKGQLGYFNVDDDLPPVSYYLDVDKRRHIKKRFVWKDEREDIVFIRSSIVLDTKKKNEIVPLLDDYGRHGSKPPYVDLLIHEQYFYEDYKAYQPDYFEKIETAVRWAGNNGYEPAFLEDCLFN